MAQAAGRFASTPPCRAGADRLRRPCSPRPTIAICITCSWKSGTPSVRSRIGARSGCGEVDRFFAVPPAKVRMHHAALDRTRPHDRHLDHEIVEAARPEPRQHRHLRAALDLEDADRVGAATPCRRRPDLRRGCASRRRADRTPRPRLRACEARRRRGSSASALRIAVSMPRPSTSILKKPSVSRSSLSQGTTVRSCMRAGSTGATSHERLGREHEAADVDRQMARKPLELARERDHAAAAARRSAIEADLGEARLARPRRVSQ